MPPSSAAPLADRVAAGDPGAVSEALNLVDDTRPERHAEALDLLDALEGRARGARIGVTGAPGAGKSTLLDALVSGLRRRERSVGILAVDPSSQRTRGALLGDRMRLGSAARDAGVFLRSLAARERLGGLSEATGPSLDVMVAAFDAVFVETVGVGQSEAEVTDLVDTLVFVVQPAAGDLIQFMKAGILEWPDVFFVNKADLGDVARHTATELQAGLELGSRRDPGFRPKVICGSARDGVEIDALIEAVDAHQDYLKASGEGERRRRAGRVARVRASLLGRFGRLGIDVLGGEAEVERAIAAEPLRSVARLTHDLVRRIESELGLDGR